MQVTLTSFGFQNGKPPDTPFILDAREITNPHHNKALRSLTGKQVDVQVEVISHPKAAELMHKVFRFVESAEDQDAERIDVAIGCTRGRHRSVALVEMVATRLATRGYHVIKRHRDLVRDELAEMANEAQVQGEYR